MKKFLVLYRSTVSPQEQMMGSTPEQTKAGMDAWMAWAKQAGSGIVDLGSPLGETAHLNGKPGAGFIGGFSIVQAASIGDARKLFDGHPHLHMPGGSIELLELMPIPGM
jgi:hypothetical protein